MAGSQLREFGKALKRRPEAAVLIAIYLLSLAVPRAIEAVTHTTVPTVYGGLYGAGLVAGVALALQAVGLVLVYRVNRIINFAQIQVGTLAALLVFTLNRSHGFLRLADVLCGSCTRGHLADATDGAPAIINFALSLAVGLIAAPLVSYLIYAVLIQQFRRAPRLVTTVLTVAIAEALAATTLQLGLSLPGFVGDPQDTSPSGVIAVPFTLDWNLPPLIFHSGEVLMPFVGTAALIALALFFRFSSIGTIIRGAAENPERAESLGIRVNAMTALIWMIAGTLSAIAAILQGFTVPIEIRVVDVHEMARVLAAAVGGGLTSLPLTALAAMILGQVEEVFVWSAQSVTLYEAALVVLVSALLLVQRTRASRAELESLSSWRASQEVRPIPQELRGFPVVKRYIRGLVAILLVIAIGLPFLLSPDQLHRMSSLFPLAIIALSLIVLTGWAGQISLGQMGLAGVGAYVTALWSTTVPFPFGLLVGAVGGGVAAFLIGIPAIRLRGLHLAVATLVFGLAITGLVLSPNYLGKFLPATVERPLLLGVDLSDEKVFYYLSILVLVGMLLLVMGLRRSRTARALIACRDNELAAQSFGINLVRTRLMAFAISGMIAGLGGSLLVYEARTLAPADFVPELSLGVFLAAVIGGFGAIAGPVIGELYVGSLSFVSPYLAVYLGTGFGLILMLVFAPGGLIHIIFAARDAVLRRIAIRYRVVVPSLLADTRSTTTGRIRATVAPNRWKTGTERFTPVRYRLANQAVGTDEDDGEKKARDENVFARIFGDSLTPREADEDG